MAFQEQYGPAVWRGSELAQREDWQYRLTSAEVEELDTALGVVTESGMPLEEIRREDFPLPTLGERLKTIQYSLEHGSGSFYLRGWPVHRYSCGERRRVFWGLCQYLGTPVSQSAAGQKIFPVQDAGHAVDHPKARGPNTRKQLRFHCDRCDVIGFLCVRQALRGGENYLVSAPAVHNEILRRRPDLLEELYRPWFYKTHNVDLANDDPWCRQPIFAVHDHRFVGYVLRVLIDRAYELPELPDMTPRQREALDFLDAVCAEPDMHFQLRQEPGDILFVNNFLNFHSRSAFEDHEDPQLKRLLLRIWLSMPNSRALPPLFAGSFGNTGAGELRGGIHPQP
ncbi:MAG: TauD/TfdA family dioxygenase [Acidobacteriota bacterium]|nr:TauD/TfdA family dioxygenase [Acidobacteriota bacterium]